MKSEENIVSFLVETLVQTWRTRPSSNDLPYMCLATVQKAMHKGGWHHGHLSLPKESRVCSVHVRGVGRGADVGWWARIHWDNRRHHAGSCSSKNQDLGPQRGGEWKYEWIGWWGRATQASVGDAVLAIILGSISIVCSEDKPKETNDADISWSIHCSLSTCHIRCCLTMWHVLLSCICMTPQEP